MKRLSDLDTLFLTLDNERYPLHGGGLLVFDPSTSPEPWTLAHVRDHLIRLLPVMPPLRRRLVEVPFGLAAPVWVEDPEFNIDDHLHTLGIPAPGGDRELAAVADEIGSLPIDWRRPLWDLWFLEGLADGRKAIILRMHHAAVDGMGGVEMIFQMFSAEPGGEAIGAKEDDWKPEPVPSQGEMFVRALPTVVMRPVRTVRALAGLGGVILQRSIKSATRSEDKPDTGSGARPARCMRPDCRRGRNAAAGSAEIAAIAATRSLIFPGFRPIFAFFGEQNVIRVFAPGV